LDINKFIWPYRYGTPAWLRMGMCAASLFRKRPDSGEKERFFGYRIFRRNLEFRPRFAVLTHGCLFLFHAHDRPASPDMIVAGSPGLSATYGERPLRSGTSAVSARESRLRNVTILRHFLRPCPLNTRAARRQTSG
jgi:hypothetical protein